MRHDKERDGRFVDTVFLMRSTKAECESLRVSEPEACDSGFSRECGRSCRTLIKQKYTDPTCVCSANKFDCLHTPLG